MPDCGVSACGVSATGGSRFWCTVRRLSRAAPAGRRAPRVPGPLLAALGILVFALGCTTNDRYREATAAAPPERHPLASRRARELIAEGPLDGIALGLFSQEPSFDYRPLLAEIAALGSRWVSLVVNHYQARFDSSEVDCRDTRTPSREKVAEVVRQGHDLGLRILLFPIVLLQDPRENDWRGTLAPVDRAAWFRSYETLLSSYADLARDEGVELLSIGSEYNSLDKDPEPWRRLIVALRGRYSGALTYSVNWDSLDGPAFLGELDFVGMTTYFSLTAEDDPSLLELRAAWVPLREEILGWITHLGMPVLFTEVGFASQNGINKDPWNYYISPVIDLEEQRDCYQAFADCWQGAPELSGVFFYNWFGSGGPDDSGYTPRGKPAAAVLERWFRQATRARSP